MIYIIAYLAGIFYRFSEVEYIWAKAYLAGNKLGWRWGRDSNVQYYLLRNWCKGWMSGILTKGWGPNSSWFWRFHRMTGSMFEDGYHTFRLLTQLSLFALGGLTSWNIWELLIIVVIRWIGTQTGRAMIIKDVDHEQFPIQERAT